MKNAKTTERKATLKTYIVLVLGCWGRGQTIVEAAQNCEKAGGRKTDKAALTLVIGDDKAEVCFPCVSAAAGSEIVQMGVFKKLSMLLTVKGC